MTLLLQLQWKGSRYYYRVGRGGGGVSNGLSDGDDGDRQRTKERDRHDFHGRGLNYNVVGNGDGFALPAILSVKDIMRRRHEAEQQQHDPIQAHANLHNINNNNNNNNTFSSSSSHATATTAAAATGSTTTTTENTGGNGPATDRRRRHAFMHRGHNHHLTTAAAKSKTSMPSGHHRNANVNGGQDSSESEGE